MKAITEDSVVMCCPAPGCGQELVLPAPKGKRKGHRSGWQRTGVVCEGCKKGEFAYWEKPSKIWDAWSKQYTPIMCLKIPNPIIDCQLVVFCCPMCGIRLSLPVAMWRPRPWICGKCLCSFSYELHKESRRKSSPNGERRLCLYPKIEDYRNKRARFEHRSLTQDKWVSPPQKST